VFGGNLIHCRVGFCLNFKFKQAHLSASYFRSLASAAYCTLLPAACCHCLLLVVAAACRSVVSPLRTRVPSHRKRPVAITLPPPRAAPPPLPHACPWPLKWAASIFKSTKPFTRYCVAPFLSLPEWACDSSFLCRHYRRAHLIVTPPLRCNLEPTNTRNGSVLDPRCFHTQPCHRSHSELTAFQLFPGGCEQYHRHCRWEPLLPLSSASFSARWRTSLTSFPSLLVDPVAQHRTSVRHHNRPSWTAPSGPPPLLPPEWGAAPRSIEAHRPRKWAPLPLLWALSIADPPTSATTRRRPPRVSIGVRDTSHRVCCDVLFSLWQASPSPVSRTSLWWLRRRKPLSHRRWILFLERISI
jgi:hypothetical protein